MTPLDAARHLAMIQPVWQAADGERFCKACDGMPGAAFGEGDFPHLPDCPWLALPAIVRALEAAEALTPIFKPPIQAKRYRRLHAILNGDPPA